MPRTRRARTRARSKLIWTARPLSSPIATTLDRVDWNFSGSATPEMSLHSLHWFPGNFIPQIPSYLIQLLSEPGDLILDPFCGSGTTGVEAALMGRRAWMSDVNRASIQVTLGKTAALTSKGHLGEMRQIASELVWEGILVSDDVGANGEGGNRELAEWFHADTLGQLRYLWKVIESASTASVRQVLEMLFADSLFACA